MPDKSKRLRVTRRGLALLCALFVGWLGVDPPAWFVSAAGRAGACRRVQVADRELGISATALEDLSAAPGRGVLVSAQRLSGAAGGALFLVDPTRPEAARLVAVDGALPLPFRPHGIDAHRFGARLVIAVAVKGSGALLLELPDDAERAKVVARLEGEPDVNGIVLASPDKAFVTLDHAATDTMPRLIEILGGGSGRVLALTREGEHLRTEALPMRPAFANGIALASGRLWVAATRGGELLSAQEPERRITLPGAPDNLTVAPDGRLVAALLPDLLRLGLRRAGLPLPAPLASRVLAIDPHDGSQELLFQDAGHRLSAATAALLTQEHLLIASLYDDALLICSASPP